MFKADNNLRGEIHDAGFELSFEVSFEMSLVVDSRPWKANSMAKTLPDSISTKMLTRMGNDRVRRERSYLEGLESLPDSAPSPG